MKKRTAVLVLTMALSLSIVGCGNSAEPKQGEVQQEKVEQGKQEAESTVIAENDVLVITGEEDRYSEYDFTVFTNSEAFGEEKTFNENSPVYSTDGVQVGYIKAGSTIKIDEALNLVWYCFKNPISGTDYDKLYVLQDYFSDSQDFSVDAQEEEIQQEETVVDPYDTILEKVGYDKTKEYTRDEYLEILTNIFEEMGKENNLELAGMNPMDSYDGFHIQLTYGITEYTEETTESLMNYIENAKDGWGGITEFCIVKAEKDGVEGLNLFAKIDNEVVQKNMSEWQ